MELLENPHCFIDYLLRNTMVDDLMMKYYLFSHEVQKYTIDNKGDEFELPGKIHSLG